MENMKIKELEYLYKEIGIILETQCKTRNDFDNIVIATYRRFKGTYKEDDLNYIFDRLVKRFKN